MGAVVGPTTPVVDSTPQSTGTYGAYIEFTGRVFLRKNENVIICDDDGVSLMIDGELIPGLFSGVTSVRAQSLLFAGTTGYHTIDLVYANNQGPGFLTFGPRM